MLPPSQRRSAFNAMRLSERIGPPRSIASPAAVLLVAASLGAAEKVTFPRISESKIPIVELKVSDTAYAAVRKPPGEGPYPAIVLMHGGLGQSAPARLRRAALETPAHSRFLAWGYVTVTATRRNIQHDPGDRGVVDDTLAIVREVKKLPYVDGESVALYGGSGGGTLALEVGSVSNELAAIVAGEPASIVYMGMFTKEHVVLDDDGRPTGDRRWDVMNADPQTLYTAAVRERTRRKLRGLSTPTLILHGDRHALKGFNLDVLVPEMEAMRKPVTVIEYPGEFHGFYWGQGRIPPLAKKANQDADAYLRKHIKVQPKPVNGSLAEWVEVEALPRPNPN